MVKIEGFTYIKYTMRTAMCRTWDMSVMLYMGIRVSGNMQYARRWLYMDCGTMGIKAWWPSEKAGKS